MAFELTRPMVCVPVQAARPGIRLCPVCKGEARWCPQCWGAGMVAAASWFGLLTRLEIDALERKLARTLAQTTWP